MAPLRSTHPLARLAGRLENDRFARELRALVPGALAAVPNTVLPPAERTVLGVHRTGTRIGVARLGRPEAPDAAAILLIAQTVDGSRLLRHRASAQRRVRELPGLEGWDLVPEVVAEGLVAGRGFVLERALPGEPPTIAAWGTALGRRLRAEAAQAAGRLHAATRSEQTIDSSVADRWVRRPMSRIRAALSSAGRSGTTAAPFVSLEGVLVGTLVGRSMPAGWIHGDLWPGNLLADPSGRLRGIVDWDRAGPGELAIHDLLHLVLYARSREAGVEPGTLIAEAVGGAPWSDEDAAILGRAPEWAAAGEPERRQLILLYWLRFVAATVDQSSWFARNPDWVRDNVDAVLRAT